MRSFFAGLLFVLTLTLCVEAQDEQSKQSADRNTSETAFAVAFGLPRIVAMNAYLSRSLVVEAVYQATALSGGGMVGRIVNTGTLAPGYGGGFQ